MNSRTEGEAFKNKNYDQFCLNFYIVTFFHSIFQNRSVELNIIILIINTIKQKKKVLKMQLFGKLIHFYLAIGLFCLATCVSERQLRK